MVQSLGADTVIDYTQADFTNDSETYNIVFDAAGTTFSPCKHALKHNG